MGLSEEQFWDLSPRLFGVLCGRKQKEDRRELANAALITATLINLNRGKGKRALSVEDIIGKECEEDDGAEASPNVMLAFMEELHRKHGKKK